MNNASEKIRPVRHLIIIESAGKTQALQAALKRSPIDDVHILATGGHLYDLPNDLNQVGIDRHLREVGRQAKRPQQVAAIQAWAKKAQRVMITCDADQEGDVLAWDIAMLLEEVEHNNFSRVRLRSLDVEGVLYAFLHPETVQYRDAWPGTARRMLDRLIGSTYGQRDITGVDLSVGRVQSALLGAAAKEKIPYGEATIALPCCDRKEPFVATIPVFEHNLKAVQELIAMAKEFEESGQCVAFGKAAPVEGPHPWNFSEAVLSISQATQRPIDAVAQSMQRLYESGRMSYPRSDASAVTAQGLAAMQKMAEQHGVRFDASRVSAFSRNGRHAHESPRPLQSDVNITSPLLVLSNDEAALSLISRQLLSCGQPHAVHSPDPSALPGWAKNLVFERKVCQWLRPWPKKNAQTGLRIFPKEEIALSLLLKNKLGRSSTVVFHALKFASRGLLDEHAQIESKGMNWIQRTPEILMNPQTSQRIENILSTCVDDSKINEAPQQLVKSLLESMNLWGEVQQMLQRVEAAQPGPGSGIHN